LPTVRTAPYTGVGFTPMSNADQSGAGHKPVRRDTNRRVIDATCSMHGGAHGFTPLVCTKRDDLIELNPHAMNGCVIILDEKAASELFDVLGEWLG
jgi:hypothetical protein